MCAVVLLSFSFFWLYFFQSDVLFVAQHVLSEGQTQYKRTAGALIIVGVMWLLQVLVARTIKLDRRGYALTWAPSMLMLAYITSVSPDHNGHWGLGFWYWLLPISILLWFGCVWMARMMQSYEAGESGVFSRRMWVNLLFIVGMICGVAVCGNTNAVYHYRAHAEVSLKNGDIDEALRVGARSHETDGNLMMLRMYALSRQQLLGEHLFEYPIVPTSDAILPTADAVKLLAYPSDSLYRHLGAIPRRPMKPMDYLQTIMRSGQAKPAAADYLLCGYLIDRDLDSFAKSVGQYYTINDSLPRYYREALVLYTHKRSHPTVVYHNTVLDEDYADFQKMEAECTSTTERKGKVLENYANSYWYYFEYAAR
jgi:hypothetical protein